MATLHHVGLERAEKFNIDLGPRAVVSKADFTNFSVSCRAFSKKKMRPTTSCSFRACAVPGFFRTGSGLGPAPHPSLGDGDGVYVHYTLVYVYT